MKIRASEIEVATFGGWLILAFANTCEILSLLPKGRYFRRGGGGGKREVVFLETGYGNTKALVARNMVNT